MIDLLAERPGERLSVEIETGKSNIQENIKKLRRADFDRVILVATSPAAVTACQKAVDAVRLQTGLVPRVGIVMGTGLGGLAARIDADVEIPYEEIPHFPLSTVESHAGRLILGTLAGTPVVAMQGRFHQYEGYSLQEVAFPIRVLKLLGAEILVASGITGGAAGIKKQKRVVSFYDPFRFMRRMRGKHFAMRVHVRCTLPETNIVFDLRKPRP